MEWLQLASHEALAGSSRLIHRVGLYSSREVSYVLPKQRVRARGNPQCAMCRQRLSFSVQVLHLSATGGCLLQNVLVEHAGVFARPEVLKEGFQAASAKPSMDAAKAVTSQELALLQVVTVQCLPTSEAIKMQPLRDGVFRYCRHASTVHLKEPLAGATCTCPVRL